MKKVTFVTQPDVASGATELTVRLLGTPEEVERLSGSLQREAFNAGFQPVVAGANLAARPQKFIAGDLVRIADDLGPSMSHFRSGETAIVKYSYADKFRRGCNDEYCLLFEDGTQSSWYCEYQLSMVEPGQFDLLAKWAVKN